MLEATETTREPQPNGHGMFAGYRPSKPMPLGGYAALVGIWSTGLATFLALYRDRLPRRVAWGDFALLAIATHKLARIVTKDWVTAPMRAPFVEYDESMGGGEVAERSRGRGLRRAIGDLLTCQFCIAPWIAGALGAGFVVRPRIARFVATIFGAVAVSDTLQHVYTAEKQLVRRTA
jgi:hypothetical protein